MNQSDIRAFLQLFREAFQKCFGHPLAESLNESESRYFANSIFEQTGLVIGAKSIKNYSQFVVDPSGKKEENPSPATLDTLARYVLQAPYSNEGERKEKESQYQYWFKYREQISSSSSKKRLPKSWMFILVGLASISIVFTILFAVHPLQQPKVDTFADNFQNLDMDSMSGRGWQVLSPDSSYWNRRTESPGFLTLFTLRGDNWPDSVESPRIRNLLLRNISSECFTAEIHLTSFVPSRNWQQAGILLLEDTAFKGKSLRLSIAFNNYFGGYSKPGEILVQAITSLGNGLNKPEELAHVPLFALEPGSMEHIAINMEKSALRIEKKGKKFRLLYSSSPLENYAFKEIASHEFDLEPKYIGIFALKGFVNDTTIAPVHFKFFSITSDPCY